MKKITMLIVLLAIMSIYAQGKIGAIKAGLFKPGACDAGFDLGIEYGLHIDTNLDVAIEMGWFKKDYEDEDFEKEYENVPGLVGADMAQLSETTIYDFPLMVLVTAKFPINFKYKWFATGGLGAEMLYASYNTFDDDTKHELAFDFNWRLGGGMIYNLGERSEVLMEVGYHYSKPSYEYEDNISGTDVTFKREYDMSGILGRVGVRFFFN
ncbi:MAG: outer membrane beta-barrel protein [Candidatus Delongbacteria bacterium]|nr:outer membrane beta-barrel protein [Candidatus Delongbacteria bacterium]